MSHCALEVGEPYGYPFVVVPVETPPKCDDLNYINEMKDYLFDNDLGQSNQRVRQLFECIISDTSSYKHHIKSSDKKSFSADEIKDALHTSYVKTDKNEALIDFITDDYYFSLWWKVKAELVEAHKAYKDKSFVDFESRCAQPLENASSDRLDSGQQLLYRTEVDSFITALEQASPFLIKINESTDYLQAHITKPANDRESLENAIKLALQDPSFIEKNQSSLLQNISSEDLESLIHEFVEKFSSKDSLNLSYYEQWGAYYVTEKSQKEILLNLKYFFLNLYLTDFLFKLYDKNNDLTLDNKELNNAFCLFEPLITIYISKQRLKGKTQSELSWLKKPFYSSRNVYHYVLQNKKQPELDVGYTIFVLRQPDSLINQGDLFSALVPLFFELIFVSESSQ